MRDEAESGFVPRAPRAAASRRAAICPTTARSVASPAR